MPTTPSADFDKFKLLFQLECLMLTKKPLAYVEQLDFAWLQRILNAHHVSHGLKRYYIDGFKKENIVCLEFEGRVWNPGYGFDAINTWLDIALLRHQEHLLIKEEASYSHDKPLEKSLFEYEWAEAQGQEFSRPYLALKKTNPTNVFVQAICSSSAHIDAQARVGEEELSDEVVFVDLNALPGLSMDEIHRLTTFSLSTDDVERRPIDDDGNRVFSSDDKLIIRSHENFQEKFRRLLGHHQEEGDEFLIYNKHWRKIKDSSGIWNPASVLKLRFDLNDKAVQQAVLDVVEAQSFLNQMVGIVDEDASNLYEDENVIFAQTLRFVSSELPNLFMVNIDKVQELKFSQLPESVNKSLIRRCEQIRLADELQRNVKKIKPLNHRPYVPGVHRF